MQQVNLFKRTLLGDGSPGLPRPGTARAILRAVRILLTAGAAGVCASVHAEANVMTEYQLKAAYLYNFITFTEWPIDPDSTLTLCIYGPDPFGADIDKFQGQNVNGHEVRLLRTSSADQLQGCQIVFISSAVISASRPKILTM